MDRFAELMAKPPGADWEFFCKICRRRLRGKEAVIHEDSSVTCKGCTGRKRDRKEEP